MIILDIWSCAHFLGEVSRKSLAALPDGKMELEMAYPPSPTTFTPERRAGSSSPSSCHRLSSRSCYQQSFECLGRDQELVFPLPVFGTVVTGDFGGREAREQRSKGKEMRG